MVESTRKAVQRAIDRLGYIPNQLAGGLASSRTRTIGLVVPTIVSNMFFYTLDGLNSVLVPAGYRVNLGVSDFRLDTEWELVSSFIGQKASGVCLTGVTHDERTRKLLRKSGLPVVETITLSDDPIDMAVGHSNEDAAYAMVEYLVSCGYRRIGLIVAPPQNNDRAIRRRAGYLRAVRDFGLPRKSGLIREAFYTLEHAGDAFAKLIAEDPAVDAVFCANDVLAAGAIFAARRLGLRVPEDVAIAGYDNIDIARYCFPAITTVHVLGPTASTAAQMLLNRLAGEEPPSRIVDFGFQIVPRESTGRR